MAGSRTGPVGKRTAERSHHGPQAGGENAQLGPEDFDKLPFEVELLVEPPEPDGDWHKIAYQMYEACLRDPARVWMGPMDWATLYLMCENLSREMKPQVVGIVDGGMDVETGEQISGHVAREVVPMKGTSVAALLRFLMAIGVTEAGRMGIKREVTFHQEAAIGSEVGEEDVAGGDRNVLPFATPEKR